MASGCRTCGTLNPAGATTCGYCGASLPSTPLYRDPFVSRPAPPAPPPSPPAVALKDPSTGLLLELLPGFCGFLGIGYLWAGETALGLGLLFGYWLFWAFVGVGIVVTFGLLLCLLPFFGLVYLAAPIVSALLLQQRLRRRQLLAARAW